MSTTMGGAVKASQCDVAMNTQEAIISDLSVTVDSLEVRLASCATEPVPAAGEAALGKTPDLVKTAQRIDDLTNRVRIINGRLKSLIGRIEI